MWNSCCYVVIVAILVIHTLHEFAFALPEPLPGARSEISASSPFYWSSSNWSPSYRNPYDVMYVHRRNYFNERSGLEPLILRREISPNAPYRRSRYNNALSRRRSVDTDNPVAQPPATIEPLTMSIPIQSFIVNSPPFFANSHDAIIFNEEDDDESLAPYPVVAETDYDKRKNVAKSNAKTNTVTLQESRTTLQQKPKEQQVSPSAVSLPGTMQDSPKTKTTLSAPTTKNHKVKKPNPYQPKLISPSFTNETTTSGPVYALLETSSMSPKSKRHSRHFSY